MKIKVTRELKIAMLEAFRTGYLDLWKVPDILKEIQNMNVFAEMLREASIADSEANKSKG